MGGGFCVVEQKFRPTWANFGLCAGGTKIFNLIGSKKFNGPETCFCKEKLTSQGGGKLVGPTPFPWGSNWPDFLRTPVASYRHWEAVIFPVVKHSASSDFSGFSVRSEGGELS